MAALIPCGKSRSVWQSRRTHAWQGSPFGAKRFCNKTYTYNGLISGVVPSCFANQLPWVETLSQYGVDGQAPGYQATFLDPFYKQFLGGYLESPDPSCGGIAPPELVTLTSSYNGDDGPWRKYSVSWSGVGACEVLVSYGAAVSRQDFLDQWEALHDTADDAWENVLAYDVAHDIDANWHYDPAGAVVVYAPTYTSGDPASCQCKPDALELKSLAVTTSIASAAGATEQLALADFLEVHHVQLAPLRTYRKRYLRGVLVESATPISCTSYTEQPTTRTLFESPDVDAMMTGGYADEWNVFEFGVTCP
jgi:hypothetical protein